jgi:hypothetical protein
VKLPDTILLIGGRDGPSLAFNDDASVFLIVRGIWRKNHEIGARMARADAQREFYLDVSLGVLVLANK